MNIKSAGLTGPLGACALILLNAAGARAAISFTDITHWAGIPDGPGIRRAAMVIDWRDGQPPLVWGYRWGSERRTGADMLAAVLGSDGALAVDDIGFPNTFSYGPRTRSFSDNGTPAYYLDDRYWGYSVNNDVYNHPTNFLLNSHIVPPSLVVVPLGNPYAGATWTESNTGVAGRELADGSWDGWAYGPYGTVPQEPVPVPEPGGLLAAVGAAVFLSRRRRAVAAASLFMTASVHASGPYSGGPEDAGSDAVPASSMAIRSWARAVTAFTAGPQKLGATSALANYGTDASVLGPANATGDDSDYLDLMPDAPTVVRSLGDGGRITLRFEPAIADASGMDFAVFENGFGSDPVFAELAFVEVSSDGVNFTRFPAVSCTQTATQNGTFSTLSPVDLKNLAGKYPASWGTPFDLAELTGTPGLNTQRITHVRIIDVVGSITPGTGSTDSHGRLINDPWPTQFVTCGFDLDAVGVLHQAADPWLAWATANFTAPELQDAAISGPDADPDKDGRTNLMEYATGGQPKMRDAAALRIRMASGGPEVFLTTPPASDAILRVQRSSKLTGWETMAQSQGGSPFSFPAQPAPGISVTAGTTTLRPAVSTAAYFRLQVARP